MYIRDENNIIVVYEDKESFIHSSHWLSEASDLKKDDAIFVS